MWVKVYLYTGVTFESARNVANISVTYDYRSKTWKIFLCFYDKTQEKWESHWMNKHWIIHERPRRNSNILYHGWISNEIVKEQGKELQ